MTHLVLLHGWGTTGQVWRRQQGVFARLGIKVLTPTFPTWEASWLLSYLKDLPLPHTVLVGWSLGGMLLLEALSELDGAPAALVLVATPVKFCLSEDHPAGHPPEVVRALRRALRQDSREVLADFAARCLAPEEAGFQAEVRECFSYPLEPAYLAAGLDYLLKQDLRPFLARVPAGAHILQGEADPIVPPAQARILVQKLPEAEKVTFPGAGHLPFLTQEQAFNRFLGEILGKV